MKLSETANTAARLAVVSEKSQTAFNKALWIWFSAQFAIGMKLPLLRSVYSAGAFPAFTELLSASVDSERLRIEILRKVDPHSQDILTRSKSEMITHLEDLASGRREPTPKPKASKRAGGSGGRIAPKNANKTHGQAKKEVSVISGSKY
jgi:hypothetical protein